MQFSPQQFEGKKLAELVDQVAKLDRDAVLGKAFETNLDGFAQLSTAKVPPLRDEGDGQTRTWRTQNPWPRQGSGETVPSEDHPPVSVADVDLIKFIARGQQGVVYFGRVRSTGLIVAVKVMPRAHRSDSGRAIRELSITSKLTHPSILRVFEARDAGEFVVVIMEYLEGEDLAHTRLHVSALRSAAASLTDAIMAMARARIVHRDIKPANIVRRRADGKPVLVDFGLAVDLNEDSQYMPGIGTPLFMAPEAINGMSPESSWDVYSLAITVIILQAKEVIPEFSSLDELFVSKKDGAFDRELIQRLNGRKDIALCNWCVQVIGTSGDRLSLI